MMKKGVACLVCLLSLVLHGQDSVQYRLMLIGDAGEINSTQQSILRDAAARAIPGKTLALFLGDNIYPKGMELDNAGRKSSEDILRSQFQLLRAQHIPVYFVPGNHDWDKSGPNGFEKMQAANAFISAQNDSSLQMIPSDACPGPTALMVTDQLVIISMDSEWWLYPYDKHTALSDCPCKTKRDVLGMLDDMLERYRDKTIIFATHHPFVTYGSHGGYYSLTEHLFPLTDLNKRLYIPLPVIGSLYPLLRKAFPPAEDEKNVLYQDMIHSVNEILKKHPNVIHAAGHEHTLQLVQDEVLQIVSGAGCKHTPVKKGRGSLYAAAKSGYVILDLLKNNDVRVHFYTEDDKGVQPTFVYNQPYHAPPEKRTFTGQDVNADTVRQALQPSFQKVSGIHRFLFGNNYRRAWAAAVSIPVLRLSAKGLRPEERGGGMQTHSLRLLDNKGEEWVLRSLDKFPDALLPDVLNQTLAAELLHDNVSAIYPFAPLSVPVFANALGVAHSNPSIVYIAPDSALGRYGRDFANSTALLEEREPLGHSSSTIKMQDKLKEDNDNRVDQPAFLKARVQDIFLGDWDRHGDQWRWVDEAKGKGKIYRPVPRDRDQVFYINQGLLPGILALPWILPKFQGFGPHIRNVNTLAFNARLIDGLFTNELSLEHWQGITNTAVTAFTDTVINTAIAKMPGGAADPSREAITNALKSRRAQLPQAMATYFRFLNKTPEIILSDKNEFVRFNDTLNGQLSLQVFKLTKKLEMGRLLFSRLYNPAVTKEIRLYMNGGEDKVDVHNSSAAITLRLVGNGHAVKTYNFAGSKKYLRKLHVYDADSNSVVAGITGNAHIHLNNDPQNTTQVLTNRYNNTIPLLTAGYNADDGLLIGAGLKWVKQGFRKIPYASMQQFLFTRSFSTNAFRFTYNGEWLNALGKADVVVDAKAFAPDNTQNFFGRGNSTTFNKTGNYKRFYRARFNLYQLEPALRWRSGKGNSISLGPSIQYYHFDLNDNKGRFINNVTAIHSYDSATISSDKTHAGLVAGWQHDTRNSRIFPTAGSQISFAAKGYEGLNKNSKSFIQLIGQIAVYKNLDRKSGIIIADRLGGGITVGKSAFYQSLFLGSQENLLGYRQFRFAGEHLLYNNFELRVKLFNLASYFLPGQVGFTGSYDVGKVWQRGYNDAVWHQGVGAGLYFAPAQLLVVQLVAGYSAEGWYPYFTAGFRF